VESYIYGQDLHVFMSKIFFNGGKINISPIVYEEQDTNSDIVGDYDLTDNYYLVFVEESPSRRSRITTHCYGPP